MTHKDLGFDKEQMILLPIFYIDRELTANTWERLAHRHRLVKNAFLNHWLQDFAYHIPLSILPFLAGGLLALLIALATTSALAFRAAASNPIEALRHE